MDYLFPSPLQADLSVNIQIPPHESIHLMPSVDACFRESNLGSLIMQEISREEFCINLHIFQVNDISEFKIVVEKPISTLIYVLQGQAAYCLPGMKNIQIEEGYYYLSHFPMGEHTLKLKSHIYMIVQLVLYPVLLNKLAGTYYGMYEAYNSSTNNTSNEMILNGNWMNPRICDTLSKLIYCQLEKEIGSLY